jgi:GT2 family glycosyltransferase
MVLQTNLSSILNQFLSISKNYRTKNKLWICRRLQPGFQQVDADYLVLLNSDVKVTENWIEPCIERFETDENLAAIQPKILSYNQPNLFEYAGAAGGFIDKFGYPFCRGRILNRIEEDLVNTTTIADFLGYRCLYVCKGQRI